MTATRRNGSTSPRRSAPVRRHSFFTPFVILATSVNFFPAALGGERWEVALIGICHFALIYRVRKAQTFAATKRGEDLPKFETIRATLARESNARQERDPDVARPTE